jgi:hypothetical protein
MAAEKAKVLADAPFALNRDDFPWIVTVEGDRIVGRWKWLDARFFSPNSLTDDTREYAFIVILKDNGKYREDERVYEKIGGASFQNGQLAFGGGSSAFKGKTSQKSFAMGFGQDKQNGGVGLAGGSLDTKRIKDAIRSYMSANGWKKAGLFG